MFKKSFLIVISLLLICFFSATASADVVNINKANAAALQQNLVGIGPVKAEAIVKYRKKNGAFKSINDLKNVSGIGDELIKSNKMFLSLSKGAIKADATVKKAKASKSKVTVQTLN